MIMGSPSGFLDQRMDLFYGYFWIFLSRLLQTLFWVFSRVFMRYCSHEPINSTCSMNLCHENYATDSNYFEPKSEDRAGYSKSSKDTELKSEICGEGTDTIRQECSQIDSNGCEPEVEPKKNFSDSGNLGVEEEETTKLVFKFRYQTWNCSEEFKGGYNERFDFVNTDKASASTNKYEFISGKSSTHFSKEPEASNFTVKELYARSNDCPLENDSSLLSETYFMPENCEIRCVDAVEKLKAVPSIKQPEEDEVENLNNNIFDKENSAADNFLSEDDFICLSFELDSMSSIGDGYLSDTITIELDALGLGNHDERHAGLTEEDLDFGKEKNSQNFGSDIMGELRKLEESQLQNSDMDNMEKFRGHCFQDRHSINSKPEESVKLNSDSLTGLDVDDSSRFDTLWEHQYLMEQLKMELNKVRATGLPTILENSEFPRIVEDLKPWKIDENFQHGSTINELPKFYRSYTERMRKFDILNYQKMYAIGSLQSKNPLQSFSSRENSSAAITSFLPHRFRLCRRKKSEPDPMKKFIREFYSDLEMVYVGQLCLSWEFLQWEYEKASELWESDQYGLQRYNEVAGEFQQFQVLLQRFIENEPFQGPRVENYVRNRRVMRNLLQVPVIREDNANDKKKFREREADKDAITSDMLVEILEESIRTIWRFIRADKEASSLIHKGPRETQIDPADSELVAEIRAELQKKEKRLGESLKSRSCILKKFQKLDEEDETDHFLYFFSQVDMKLVWRVLNMSRITSDQLAWCHNKLNKINFVNRRIHIEPSFLLFPC